MKKICAGLVVMVMASGCWAWPGWFGVGTLTPTGVSNLVNGMTVPVSVLSQSLGIPNGNTTLEVMSDGSMVFTVVTNTVNVYVIATNGLGFNGPVIGTVYSNRTESGRQGYWEYASDGQGTLYQKQDYNGWNLVLDEGEDWAIQSGTLPALLQLPVGGAEGELTIAWKPATNTYAYFPMADVITTNYTVTAGDVLQFEHGLLKAINP